MGCSLTEYRPPSKVALDARLDEEDDDAAAAAADGCCSIRRHPKMAISRSMFLGDSVSSW